MGKYDALFADDTQAPAKGKYSALFDEDGGYTPPLSPEQQSSSAAQARRGAMSEGEQIGRALLPRSFKAEEEGAGLVRKATAGVLDALSLPGRTIAAQSTQRLEGGPGASFMGMGGAYNARPSEARYRSATPDAPSMAESMADTEGQTLAGRIARDPALLPSLALAGPASNLARSGIAAGSRLLTGTAAATPAASKVVPTAATIVKNIAGGAGKAALQAGTTGAIEGVGSAAIHQADRAVQDGEIDFGDAATEVALSAILPAVVSGGAKLAKDVGQETAKGIMQTALKPDKRLMQGRGSKLDIQNIFDMNLDSPKGLQAMDEKIASFRANVKENYGALLEANKGKKFNIRAALSQAIKEAEDEMSNFKNADQVEGLKKGMEYWKDYLANTSLDINNGWMPIEDVAALRGGVWGAAKFNQQSPAGYAEFAEKFGHKINEQLGNRLPEARKLDALLSKTKPVETAVGNAVQRVGNNRYISLTDMLGGGAAVGGALASGDPENAKYGLGLVLGARALRSPGVSSALYRTSSVIPDISATGVTSALSRRLVSGAMRNREDEE